MSFKRVVSVSSPVKVELLAHDPAWARDAARESAVLAEALGPVLVAVHHIGSTAIAGIHAKPIIDLIPVVTDLLELDRCRDAVEALGYTWWGNMACRAGAIVSRAIR